MKNRMFSAALLFSRCETGAYPYKCFLSLVHSDDVRQPMLIVQAEPNHLIRLVVEDLTRDIRHPHGVHLA